MPSIFNNGEPTNHLARPQYVATDRFHNGTQALTRSVGMVDARSTRLSESDGAHLHEPTLYRPFETRVPFDPVDEEDALARHGDTIDPCLETFRRGPERNDLERTDDRATDGGFRYAVML